MIRPHGVRAAALALLLAASAGAIARAADVSRRLDDYVLFASEQIRTRGLHVVSGDLGVDAGSFDTRAAVDAPTSTIGADVVRMAPASTCGALFATGIDGSAPACPLAGLFNGPVVGDLTRACGLASGIPACASGTGVAVGPGEARTLPPGTYGVLDVRSGGHLALSGGQYVFCRLRAGRRAQIEVHSGSEIVVVGDVAIGPGGLLAPGTGENSAGPAVIVGGARVSFSRGAKAVARLCAPGALLIAGDEASLVGRFAARAIRTGHATVTGLAKGSVTTTSSTSSTSSSSSSLPPTTSTSSTSTSAPPTSTAPTTCTSSSTSSTVGTLPSTTTSSSTTSTSSTIASNTTSTLPQSTTTTTSTTTSTTRPAAVCGNRIIEPGETCDDGNTADGDSCPSSCRIETCTAVPGTTRVFTVNFAAPAGSDVAGITVLVDYPEGKVSIPGSGGEATVKASITNLPTGSLGTPNDLDYAVREVVASFSPIPQGRLFTLTFQTCQGATAPTDGEFVCRVEDAADQLGLPVDGVTCTVQSG